MTRARDTSEIFLGPVAIQSGGTSIGEVNTINFVGTGNTFAVSGTSVDVSIEGGGGTSAGGRINYSDGTKSPFMVSVAHVTKNINLDDTTTGETIDCNIVIAESQMVIDSGIGLTIGQGKKTIPDLYKVAKDRTFYHS